MQSDKSFPLSKKKIIIIIIFHFNFKNENLVIYI